MDLSIKTFLSTAVILISISSASASDVVYAPGNCPPENLTLWVANKTPRMQRVWTQTRDSGDFVDEMAFDLQPKSEIKIPGQRFLQEAHKGFSLKSWESGGLQIYSQCFDEEKLLLSGSTSPQVQHSLPNNLKSIKLSLVNLFLQDQTVRIQFQNAFGKVLFEEQVLLSKYYETVNLKLSPPVGATKMELKGQERFHSQAQVYDGSKFTLSPGYTGKPMELEASPDKAYFLVSTKENNPEQSFVIALDEPSKIATAREQIKNPSLEKIIVGGIELGNGGFNRAFQSKDKAPYTWSAFRIDAFADFAYIDCDGSPDLTEERLKDKLTNGGGRICFWRYRVVRELSLLEVRTGILKGSRP